MALINCTKCNRKISDKSDVCVGCGAPRSVFMQSRSDSFEDLVADEPSLDTRENLVNDSGPDEINNEFEIYNKNPDYDITDNNHPKMSSDLSNTENIEIEFNKDDPDYKVFKITNIVLFVIVSFIEFGYAAVEGRRGNVLPAFLTFIVSRSIIRYYFAKKSNLRKATIGYKVGAALVIWTFVFILKLIVAIIILNIAL